MTVVFRVVKTKNYTMMSNQHLKDKRLTLKAKGLMSVMLSLPENWDYTLRGLSAISREGVDAISEAVKELERSGYVACACAAGDDGQPRMGADRTGLFEIAVCARLSGCPDDYLRGDLRGAGAVNRRGNRCRQGNLDGGRVYGAVVFLPV